MGHDDFIFLANRWSLALMSISCFRILFQIRAPWYLKEAFPRFVLTEGTWHWSVCLVLWAWILLFFMKYPSSMVISSWCILYMSRLNKYLFMSSQFKNFNLLNSGSVCSLGLTPHMILIISFCNDTKEFILVLQVLPQTWLQYIKYGYMKE